MLLFSEKGWGMGALGLGTKQGKTCLSQEGKETNMKDKILGVLQRIRKLLCSPIAILPGCGPFA